MSVFNYYIDEFLFSYQNNYLKAIRVKITSDKRDFRHVAAKPYVRVLDVSTSVDAFRVEISGNQKEINALFTIDAFNSIATLNHISFGYGDKEIYLFENVDINNNISTLIAPFDGIVVPVADNYWLVNL